TLFRSDNGKVEKNLQRINVKGACKAIVEKMDGAVVQEDGSDRQKKSQKLWASEKESVRAPQKKKSCSKAACGQQPEKKPADLNQQEGPIARIGEIYPRAGKKTTRQNIWQSHAGKGWILVVLS
ncbi:MAG: hypothetical protein AB7F20_04395, partial [Geoalkalibacter sp.]|uniref:hypothetical protein n=1 Tax=Geoalkalibacter sp. TaxID=3041440 RepID=UPI003D124CE1